MNVFVKPFTVTNLWQLTLSAFDIEMENIALWEFYSAKTPTLQNLHSMLVQNFK